MFGPRPRLHGLRRLHGLHELAGLADELHANLPLKRMRYRTRPYGQPSVGRILLAGLAVFAFVKLMSTVNRPNRSRATALVLGMLLLAVGAVLMSMRRSGQRYRW
jgi:hypothetical protein